MSVGLEIERSAAFFGFHERFGQIKHRDSGMCLHVIDQLSEFAGLAAAGERGREIFRINGLFIRRQNQEICAAASGEPLLTFLKQLLPSFEVPLAEPFEPQVMVQHGVAGGEEPAVLAENDVQRRRTEKLPLPMVVGADQPPAKTEMVVEELIEVGSEVAHTG